MIGDNPPQGTAHPRILMAREVSLTWDEVEEYLGGRLTRASQSFDCKAALNILIEARTAYAPNGDVADLVWCKTGGAAIPEHHDKDGKVLRLS